MAFKFPSISQLGKSAFSGLSRFSFTLFYAVAAVIFLIWYNELDQLATREGLSETFHYAERVLLIKLSLCCSLGIALSFAISCFCEVKVLTNWRAWLFQLLALSFLIAYFFSLPAHDYPATKPLIIRYFVYNLCFHLLVAFVPFINNRQPIAFWQYNKSLFLRFLFAALFSAVLYLGLVFALICMKELLDMHIEDDFFLYLFYLCAGLVNTWIFLSGVPDDIPGLENNSNYPKGLKVFAQFILIPLLLIYFLIFYAYIVKISIEQNWPESYMISGLTLGISITGILCLLLINPYQYLEGNGWIRHFRRGFAIALIPILVIFFMAIQLRLSQYGLTELRYYLFLIACWLCGIVVYFIIAKQEAIKWVPLSLFLIGIASIIGPWNAVNMSVSSQKNRLEKLLLKNNMLVNGKIQAADSLNNDDSREMLASMEFLQEHQSLHRIGPWFDASTDSLLQANYKKGGRNRFYYRYDEEDVKLLCSKMGIAYYTNDYLAPSDSLLSITYNAANQDSRLIRGYDYINQISWYCERGGNSNQSIFLDDQLFLSASLYSDGMLHIKDSNNKELDVFNLNSLQKNLLEFDHTHSYVEAVPVNKMTYEMSGKNVRIKLYVESLDLNRENVNTSYYISQIRASLLIKLSTI